jgi:uncharacterized LabA/DUF88 family protein
MKNSMGRGRSLGALLVDLENLYLALKDDYADPDNLTVIILNNLRRYIEDDLGLMMVVGRAYAPLDYSSSRAFINDLSLLGIMPVHVLARPDKNSADLRLAIDCMEYLFNRQDIETFVIVGGDRDYIPVAEKIRENARRVIVVCPRPSMSGDLLTIVGHESYLDPIELVPPEMRVRASRQKKTPSAAPSPPPASAPSPAVSSPSSAPPVSSPSAPHEDRPAPPRPPAPQAPAKKMPATMADVEKTVADPDIMEDLKTCISLILEFLRDHKIHEVWLGPFLKTMNEIFPFKSNVERKALLSRLCDLGAIEIASRQRSDEGSTYAVIVVNWKHPLIIHMNVG